MKKAKEEWVKAYESPREVYGFPTISKTILNFFKRGSLVLEAGCGSGGVCFWLEDLGVNSLGIDIVPNIVKDAHLFAKTISSEARFIIGDVTCLPLQSESLDGVISLGVVEHFRLTDKAFQAFRET